MTNKLHAYYNFYPFCIIFPTLSLPKIDKFRDMAVSNVFWDFVFPNILKRCFFSYSVSSLCFKLSFFLVKTYRFETHDHLWETKGKSKGPLNQQNQTRLFNIVQREDQSDIFYFMHHEQVYWYQRKNKICFFVNLWTSGNSTVSTPAGLSWWKQAAWLGCQDD